MDPIGPNKPDSPQKTRAQHDKKKGEDNTGAAILHGVQVLTQKMDEQTELLKRFERCIEANTAAAKQNNKTSLCYRKNSVIFRKKTSLPLNTLSLKQIQCDNLCTNEAEADLARTRYQYYEFGDKTSKLLAWQIKREENEKTIHSIITDDGKSLFNPHDINREFQLFYEALHKTEHGIENPRS